MIKKYILIVVSVLTLIGVLLWQNNTITNLKKEKSNLETVVAIQGDNDIKYRQYQDSINIAQVKTINSTLDNFETAFKSISEDFEKSTGRNIKHLQSTLKTQVNSKEYYYIPMTDSLVKDGTTIRRFDYKDRFNQITGYVYPDTVSLDIARSMYLTKYSYTTRNKEPWYKPWKWGKKSVTEMRSDNPKDSIVQLQEINIIK